MRIAIDMDGVLANFTKGFIRTANEIWPGRIDEDKQPDSWDWAGMGLSKDEVSEIWGLIKVTRNFWMLLSPYVRNVEELWGCIECYEDAPSRDEYYFVTSRIPTTGYSTTVQTRLWLNKQKLDQPNTIVIVKPEGGIRKRQIYKALNITASIDDYLENAIQNMTLPGNHVLLDRPWNRDGRPEGLQVVKSMREFLDLIYR